MQFPSWCTPCDEPICQLTLAFWQSDSGAELRCIRLSYAIDVAQPGTLLHPLHLISAELGNHDYS